MKKNSQLPGQFRASQVKLADLVPMHDPDAVHGEVGHIARLIYKDLDLDLVNTVYKDIFALFEGRYPSFRSCNTRFHDFQHTTDCYLAMARLMHGAVVQGVSFTRREVVLGLVTALMHDTGYIQEENDSPEQTGGAYTLVHVSRSIDFMDRYFAKKGLAFEDFELCRRCVKCTGLDVTIPGIKFESKEHALLGRILATADLLGQIAARTYLEKLTFLYREFEEAGVSGFKDELDLMSKTSAFYAATKKRLTTELEGVCKFSRSHFAARWGVDADLYAQAMDKNIEYLNFILKNHEKEYRSFLRRGGIFEQSKKECSNN
ncbi:MAG: hypothetical protein QMD09_13845 [Desulfatibacillaceae bacterium]|nr:hypothetical protein [Desulfatibacillaceae bacterium]